jgi:MarR family transcriptional regulator, transcriptional regulator for hemolysin
MPARPAEAVRGPMSVNGAMPSVCPVSAVRPVSLGLAALSVIAFLLRLPPARRHAAAHLFQALAIEGLDVKRLDIDALCYAADVPQPFPTPIGLRLAQASRTVERAFDAALGQAGGSLPVWLILLNLKISQPGNQRALAKAIGITGATLTHHLNAMDAQGLVTRTRDDANRRFQVVTLTEAGEAAFERLRAAAMAFDARLRAGFTEADLAALDAHLQHLAANVGAQETASVRVQPSDGNSPTIDAGSMIASNSSAVT